MAVAEIDAGICGFRTRLRASSEDSQMVAFAIETDCEKIGRLAALLGERAPFDAFVEISPESPGLVMASAREVLQGCCAGCAVPVGIFKAMQVATGLALPKDITIRFEKE